MNIIEFIILDLAENEKKGYIKTTEELQKVVESQKQEKRELFSRLEREMQVRVAVLFHIFNISLISKVNLILFTRM